MPTKRGLTAPEGEEPERRRSTRQKISTRPLGAPRRQTTAEGSSQPRSATPITIKVVNRASATPAPQSTTPHSNRTATAPRRIRVVAKAAPRALTISDSESDDEQPTPAPAAAPGAVWAATSDAEPEATPEAEAEPAAPAPRKAPKPKEPVPPRSAAAPTSEPESDPEIESDPETESNPRSRRQKAQNKPEAADAQLFSVSLRADAVFVRPHLWPTPKAMPASQNRQSPEELEAGEGWNLPSTERKAKYGGWSIAIWSAIRNLQRTISKAAFDELHAFERPGRAVDTKLITVKIKAGHYTARGEVPRLQVTAPISEAHPLGAFDDDKLMEVVVTTKKDCYIRISNKYQLEIQDQETQQTSALRNQAIQLRTPSLSQNPGTPCPPRRLDAAIDRARYTSAMRSSAALPPAAVTATPAPTRSPNKSSTTNKIREELTNRPPGPTFDLHQQLAGRYLCKDKKCVNRRKGVQFTFCFLEPRSKKHLNISNADLDKWKIAVARGDTTQSYPPPLLYQSWLDVQKQEESKLASGPGGSGGSRYSSGRGGGNMQNVNINIGGQLADSTILSRLQNSAAQCFPGGNGEFDLPTLPQPLPSAPPRKTAYSQAPFDIPDRSSSPPPIADSIAATKVVDFLHAFQARHFVGNTTASIAINKLLLAARGAGFSFSELRELRDEFLIKRGLKAMWIPILKAEAKDFAKEFALHQHSYLMAAPYFGYPLTLSPAVRTP